MLCPNEARYITYPALLGFSPTYFYPFDDDDDDDDDVSDFKTKTKQKDRRIGGLKAIAPAGRPVLLIVVWNEYILDGRAGVMSIDGI